MIIRRDGHEPRVALIHRPRYDDWSLPKGKLEPGEAFEDAALREVLEETGLRCLLGAELPTFRYEDRHGRPKTVRWWTMTLVAGGPQDAPRANELDQPFEPNDEVDQLRWCTAAEAAELASYEPDVALIAEALNL